MKRIIALVAALTSLLSATVAFAATTTVRVDDNVFRPKAVTIKRGDTIRWRWVGDAAHNVTVTKGPRKFRSRTKSSGSYSRRFTRRGRYTVVCTIHAGMKQTVRVVRR